MPKLDIADIFQPTILLTLALMTIIVMMILRPQGLITREAVRRFQFVQRRMGHA